jgi:hypothetical protein
MTGTPNPVTFRVTTFFGNPIVSASVSMVPISTSTGNWDWLSQLLGIPMGEIRLNSTTMTATTDSQGEVTFLCLPTAKYNVTATKAGYTFTTLIVVPTLRSYPIVATITDEGFTNAAGTSNVSMTVLSTKLNTTHGRINVTVLDTTSSITGGNIYIYRQNASVGGSAILVDTMAGVTSDFTDYSIVALNTSGTSFSVNGTFTSSRTPPTIIRVVPVGFAASPVEVGWFDSQTLFYGCLAVIVVLMMIGGATSQNGVAAAGCFLSWIFLGLGWMNYFTDTYTAVPLAAMFTIATAIVAFSYITDFKRESR